jgi:glutathione S-transferase
MKELEIFTKATCGWAERLYAALQEKQLPYKIVPSCDREGRKTRAFLSLSPYARTPTLRFGDLVLYESALINDFLEEQFPDHPLLPRDAGLRARDRLWIYHCDHMLMPALTQVLAAREGGTQESAQRDLQRALRQIVDWGLQPNKPDPFWGGERIGLVDFAYHTFFQAVGYIQAMDGAPSIIMDVALDTWRQAVAGHASVHRARKVALGIPFADDAETR